MNQNFIKKNQDLSSTTFAKISFFKKSDCFGRYNANVVKNSKRESGAGFTLIETLLYIVLFTIVIGGGMVTTHQIIQSTDASYNHVILQEEANFLFRKINWALAGLDGASSINTPSSIPPSSSDTTLDVTKSISGTSTQLTFVLTSNNLTLQEGPSGVVLPLNSSSIVVSLTPLTPLFSRLIVTGKPDAITTSFTLTTAQNGKPASQNFSITKYLRK